MEDNTNVNAAILERLEKVVQSLQENSVKMGQLLAVHDEKLTKQDRIDAVLFEKIEQVDKKLATREAFGKILEGYGKIIPNLMGGSADLEPSNYTRNFAKSYSDFTADNHSGRNIPFGVREFPMAAMMNGMALHGGIIPFGGTFLVFADYERPALRLAAIQSVRVIHEFTHDSFFIVIYL